MQHTSFAEMPCPVARTLDVIGEWWTLVIVRDALVGARRFDDFKTSGIADNILSARLRKLVEEGVFERRPYGERADRFEYVLTRKGRDLLPVIAVMWDWGKKWTKGRTNTRLVHVACGTELTDVMLRGHCESCDRDVLPTEVRPLRPTAAR
jgi:DNA-binding HxlR family transcriptional regulator